MNVVPIERKWFTDKARLQADTWRQTYSGRLPEYVVDTVTQESAMRMTRRHYEKPDHRTLVAVDGEGEGCKVIGFGEMTLTPRPQTGRPGYAELTGLYVADGWRSQGVGRAIIDACMREARHDRLALWVYRVNEEAIGFYHHLGFQDTGNMHDGFDEQCHEIEMISC